MKKLALVLLSSLFVFSLFAQKKNKTVPTEPNIDMETKIIELSMKFGDVPTTISNIYSIIAKEGEQSTYMDSLAYIYFSTRQYGSCNLVCTEILKTDANKVNILEMNAVSLKFLGDAIGSIGAYEKLLPLTNNIFHAYHLAELQYSIKRLAEAFITIQKAEQLESTEDDVLSFPVDDKQSQKVQILAAIYNLKGLIAYELDENNTEIAIQSLEKALEIQPDFVLAKNNLGIFGNNKDEEKTIIDEEGK